MFHVVLKSRNGKVGPIPVTTTSATTCPDACPLKRAGCYADGGPLALHWRAVTSGTRGTGLDDFASTIASLPDGQLWRHNQAGDLPGVGDVIDSAALSRIVTANRGKRGFTYTHKPVAGGSDVAQANAEAVAAANRDGFTVNLSANTLAEADILASLSIGPVVVVLDAVEGERVDTTTPDGRRVVTCPATYRDNVSCATCKLCAVRDRTTIVGFPAHGVSKKKAAAIARGVA
jgi:hypothetical protein